MSEQFEDLGAQCGCDPFPGRKDGGICAPCQPNMALTCEEEAILGKLREIKAQVRPITERMKEIQVHDAAILSRGISSEEQDEWNNLFTQLEMLRGLWNEWQIKLDAAIETKLILLGHRDAS